MAHSPHPEPKRTWRGGGFTGSGGFGGGGATGDGWETSAERQVRERRPGNSGGALVSGQVRPNPLAAKRPSEPEAQTSLTIRHGDTLSAISARAHMTVEQLAAVNSNFDPNKVRAGQELIIPARAEGQLTWVSMKVGRLTFEIDEPGRTRVVNGTLGQEDRGRSKRLQAQAGGSDRRVTDDGGHFIAPRFAGPKATYNHFAQDANFNRGAYRALEDDWAKANKGGNDVRVRIDVHYSSGNRRPSRLGVKWIVDGVQKHRDFGNERGGKSE